MFVLGFVNSSDSLAGREPRPKGRTDRSWTDNRVAGIILATDPRSTGRLITLARSKSDRIGTASRAHGSRAKLGGESVARALVVYRSHSGVTRRYGEEIAAFLESKGVSATVVSVGECEMSSLSDVEYLFLGCWTSGLFFVMQRPDEPWLAFVRDMPQLRRTADGGPKVALFATYKFLTGGQFPKMRAAIDGKTSEPELELKSRDGRLSARDDEALELFIR